MYILNKHLQFWFTLPVATCNHYQVHWDWYLKHTASFSLKKCNITDPQGDQVFTSAMWCLLLWPRIPVEQLTELLTESPEISSSQATPSLFWGSSQLFPALAGVARGWASSCKAKVSSWIPGQGARLGCGPGPHLGPWERQPIRFFPQWGFSPSLCLSFPLSLKVSK